MNVWHNNCDDSDSSKYNVKFADLTGKEKEEWYDKIIKQKIKNFPLISPLSSRQVKNPK